MKQQFKHILLIALLLLPLSLLAQEMKVVSFYLDESDITANMDGTIVYDQNGDKCALIKIESTEKGFTFDVGVLGIVKTEYHPGEIWLYVPYGVKSISISHPTLGMLRDYDLGMSVQEACTYIMKLSTGKIVGGYIEKDLGGNYLILTVEPKDAEVFVDENLLKVDAQGVTSTWLKYGIHQYEIFAAMHKRASGTITITNESSTEKTIILEPNYSIVTITAPNQADIYVNNEKKGTGRWNGRLGVGEYIVEARKESHYPTKTTLKVDIGESITRTLEAPIPRYGIINIQSIPAKAILLIDGKEVGISPGVYKNILIGERELTLKKDGYETLVKTVTIEEGNVLSQSFTLEAKEEINQPSQEQISAKTSGTHNGHEYVDLGLSVKWATCNVGATSPEEHGDYFAWGETQPKIKYSKDNYEYNYNPKTLPLIVDAAYVNWGGTWRMPTKLEMEELYDNCIWEWIVQNGVVGYKITSKKNGNSIFLPAVGRYSNTLIKNATEGFYWTIKSPSNIEAYGLNFNSHIVNRNLYHRHYGQSVRPVCMVGSESGTKCYTTHRVKTGDSVKSIAELYGISIAELCRLNAIKSNKVLRVGSVVRVR